MKSYFILSIHTVIFGLLFNGSFIWATPNNESARMNQNLAHQQQNEFRKNVEKQIIFQSEGNEKLLLDLKDEGRLSKDLLQRVELQMHESIDVMNTLNNKFDILVKKQTTTTGAVKENQEMLDLKKKYRAQQQRYITLQKKYQKIVSRKKKL